MNILKIKEKLEKEHLYSDLFCRHEMVLEIVEVHAMDASYAYLSRSLFGSSIWKVADASALCFCVVENEKLLQSIGGSCIVKCENVRATIYHDHFLLVLDRYATYQKVFNFSPNDLSALENVSLDHS